MTDKEQRNGLLERAEGLSDFKKIAIVVVTITVAGFTAGAASATFFSQQLRLPQDVMVNRDSIASFSERIARNTAAVEERGTLLDSLLAVTTRNGTHIEDLTNQVAGLVCVVNAQLGQGTIQACIESLREDT